MTRPNDYLAFRVVAWCLSVAFIWYATYTAGVMDGRRQESRNQFALEMQRRDACKDAAVDIWNWMVEHPGKEKS